MDLRVKITRFETRIAGNSPAIAKIRNAEAGDFGLRAAGHELIRGSLDQINTKPDKWRRVTPAVPLAKT